MKFVFPVICVVGVSALLASFISPPSVLAQSKTPTIKLSDERGTAVDVTGLATGHLEALQNQKMTPEQWTALFAVYVDRGEGVDRKDQTAMLGTYRIEKDVLRFEPRFPLARGVKYRAVFDARRLPGAGTSTEKLLETTLFLPKPKTVPTVLEKVYPTRDDLPENQLKFYLHFSAPMSRGEVYKNVRILKEDGKPVDLPFLEIDQELWNPDGTRLTLLFDPGRVKRGLKSREDAGPILEEGKTYTFVVDRTWTDANGEPLKATFKKTFRVLAPEDKKPDPKTWKLTVPAVGTTRPLTVALGKSLDHALLESRVWIEDNKGRRVLGSVEIAEKETIWRFQPKDGWKAGTYQLVVDKRLEDLAGNSVARPFEVDVEHPAEREIKTEIMKIAFEVK